MAAHQKLSPSKQIAIAKALNNGVTQASLAEKHGVHVDTIRAAGARYRKEATTVAPKKAKKAKTGGRAEAR